MIGKQYLLFVVAARFAICDIILPATLPYHALYLYDTNARVKNRASSWNVPFRNDVDYHT